MITVQELQEWLETLESDSYVAIDDGGLSLMELSLEGVSLSLGGFLEVGGVPLPEDM